MLFRRITCRSRPVVSARCCGTKAAIRRNQASRAQQQRAAMDLSIRAMAGEGSCGSSCVAQKFNPRRFPRQAAADRSHLEGMIRQRNRARVQGSRTKGNWTATAERHFRATKGICTEDMVPGKSAEDLALVWKVGSLLFLRLPVTLFLR